MQRLFATVSSARGATFVVVPHLDPARASMVAEPSSRQPPLPVVEPTDGGAVAVDHVNLIPPNAMMRLRGGVLRLTAPDAGTGAADSLDDFLTPLAGDVGPPVWRLLVTRLPPGLRCGVRPRTRPVSRSCG